MNIFINEQEQRARAGWRLLVQIILMFLFVGFGIMGIQSLLGNPSFVFMVVPQFIGITASVWVAARLMDKRPLTDYGLSLNRQWSREFLVGCAIAAAAQLSIFVIEWAAGWITITGYGWNAPTEHSFGWIIFSSLLGMLMVGFHEELFSRGYQVLNLTEAFRYPIIGTKGAVMGAVLLTSSLFGVMHIFNDHASLVSTFNITLAGVVLAVPYLLTGSLGISVGLHFSWNFVMAAVLGFPVSGINFETSVIRIEQGGAELWTGGSFGPEAGFIGWIGMAIMLGLSLVYIKAEGYDLTLAKLFTKEFKSAGKSDEQTR